MERAVAPGVDLYVLARLLGRAEVIEAVEAALSIEELEEERSGALAIDLNGCGCGGGGSGGGSSSEICRCWCVGRRHRNGAGGGG